jgi:hypothetical protein
VYVVTEHSPNTPIYKDGKIRCIDAFNGTEIWTLTGYGGTHASNTQVAAAEGFLVFLNSYDMQIYSVGRGPSATTVTIQNDVISQGNSVLVKGTIMDIAPGTKQKEQAARFPSGVAAVSDDSMSNWMEYVYQQKPRPTDVSGVEVVVSVLDPNNNSYEVGRTKSDSHGMFKLMFTPEVPGEYTVIATFPGSQGYWPSQGTTALGVLETSPVATSQPTTLTSSVAETYPVPAIVGLFIFVAIIGVAIMLMLRKRP